MQDLRASDKLRLVLIGTVVLGVGGVGGVSATPPAGGSRSKRVVHYFDFDERDQGNLENVPKYWTAVRIEGFPKFAQGTFDFGVGKTAPPSFHLASEGRNAAYRYAGPDTDVRENSEYRIEGYIRPEGLSHGRACLGAYFLDAFDHPLVGTLVRSRYVGGPGEPAEWHTVELNLPAAPPEARTIGLSVWVLQGSFWDLGVPMRRHIQRVDVFGGAWFDDITIHALPRVEITTTAPGNVLAPGEPQELQIILADDEDAELEARLLITDADGTVVETRQVSAVTTGPVTPTSIPLDHLPPGLYRARLDVLADLALNTSRAVTFARLAPLHREGAGNARPFGVIVEPRSRSAPAVELALLRHQAAKSVKLPIFWKNCDRAEEAKRSPVGHEIRTD